MFSNSGNCYNILLTNSINFFTIQNISDGQFYRSIHNTWSTLPPNLEYPDCKQPDIRCPANVWAVWVSSITWRCHMWSALWWWHMSWRFSWPDIPPTTCGMFKATLLFVTIMSNLPTIRAVPENNERRALLLNCRLSTMTKRHISNIRQMSAVLSTFPWSTDFLVKDIKTLLKNEHYSVCSQRLFQLCYETCCL